MAGGAHIFEYHGVVQLGYHNISRVVSISGWSGTMWLLLDFRAKSTSSYGTRSNARVIFYDGSQSLGRVVLAAGETLDTGWQHRLGDVSSIVAEPRSPSILASGTDGPHTNGVSLTTTKFGNMRTVATDVWGGKPIMLVFHRLGNTKAAEPIPERGGRTFDQVAADYTPYCDRVAVDPYPQPRNDNTTDFPLSIIDEELNAVSPAPTTLSSFRESISIWQVGPMRVGELLGLTATRVLLIVAFPVLVLHTTQTEASPVRLLHRSEGET